MRISYLRQREPIDQIVESTLSRFWTSRFGEECVARWQPDKSRSADTNTWICNAWLNVIFPWYVHHDAFEPIYREYSRSTVAWRRPFQKLYVQLATTHTFARWLGHGTMSVNRVLPDQEDTIVVPGNSKLRVLVRNQDRCYGLLKEGFPADRFVHELDTRTAAANVGVHVPQLLERHDDQGWFCEQYVAATPVNRLSDDQAQQFAVVEAAQNLRLLVDATAETTSLAAYVEDCVSQAQTQLESNPLIDDETKQQLRGQLAELQQRVLLDAPDELPTALAHGDFQPANILVNSSGVWIIDWEYAQRRQVGFDAVTYISGSRSPAGLATRLLTLARGPAAKQNTIVAALGLPSQEWYSAGSRTRVLNLFLIEELCFHLHENNNPLFRCLNHGFQRFVDELQAWLTS
jgi:aminoglycoside phosphotransferase